MGKWKVLAVLVIALALAASGCIGGGTGSVTSTSNHLESSSSQSIPSPTPTQAPSNPRLNPMKAVESIKSFSYVETANVTMNVTMEIKNTSRQSTKVAMKIIEEGYVNLEEKVAQINMSTTTFPDNVTVKVERTIINDTEYIKTPMGIVKTGDGRYIWKTNPLAIAKWLLENERPVANYTEKGSLVLVYSANPKMITPLAKLYFTTPGMNITVLDATVKLVFKNNTFAGEELVYSIKATAVTEDSLLGKILVEQTGVWSGKVEITSINEKRKVKAPST